MKNINREITAKYITLTLSPKYYHGFLSFSIRNLKKDYILITYSIDAPAYPYI